MSKTRKIRRARKARDRATAQAKIATAQAKVAEAHREAVEARVAKIVFNFQMLTQLVGDLGNSSLFYALVHGVHQTGVRTLNPEVAVPEVSTVSQRKREGMASMANLNDVKQNTLHVLATFIKENADKVGHTLYVDYNGKKQLAMDLEALKLMPERYLARELSEIFAEELKGVRNV